MDALIKKYWVPGAILVDTPYFKMKNGGALFPYQEDFEILKPNDIVDGQPCLVIDDKRPQSVFNEYYAASWFSSFYVGAEFLLKTYADAKKHFEEREKELHQILKEIYEKALKESVLKYLYLSIVASYETYITDIFLIRLTSDRDLFIKYAQKFHRNEASKTIPYDNQSFNLWEQAVIDAVFRDSKANVKSTDEKIKMLFNIRISNLLVELDTIFQNRHSIAHKNGKGKDGKLLIITEEVIVSSEKCITMVVDTIDAKIKELGLTKD